MKHTLILVVLTCLPGQAIYAACKDLLNLELPDARIETAQMIAEPVPHCKTTGTIGRNIGFLLWLPEQWNGRFVMGGAGGFVRPEDNQALRLLGDSVLTRGYATASTDTGHRGEAGDLHRRVERRAGSSLPPVAATRRGPRDARRCRPRRHGH